MRILGCLIPQARTAKEVGDLLKVQSNTRYYHIAELEKAGMVKVVDTVITSGIQQKIYRATGKYFRIVPTLLHSSDPEPSQPVADFLANTITNTVDDLRRTFATGLAADRPGITNVSRRIIRTSPANAEAFRERFNLLEQDFEAMHDENAEMPLELAYAYFPYVDADEPPKE